MDPVRDPFERSASERRPTRQATGVFIVVSSPSWAVLLGLDRVGYLLCCYRFLRGLKMLPEFRICTVDGFASRSSLCTEGFDPSLFLLLPRVFPGNYPVLSCFRGFTSDRFLKKFASIKKFLFRKWFYFSLLSLGWDIPPIY